MQRTNPAASPSRRRFSRSNKSRSRIGRVLLGLTLFGVAAALLVTSTADRTQAADAQLMPWGMSWRVNTFTTGRQDAPRVAIDNLGWGTIAWNSDQQDLSLRGVYSQHYDDDGIATGTEWRINQTTTGDQTLTDVKQAIFSGKVYANFTWTGPDANLTGTYFQQYIDEVPISLTDIPANTQTTGTQSPSSTFMSERTPVIHGGYCMEGFGVASDVFCSVGDYGNGGPYHAAGETVANPIRPSGIIPPEFQINTYTTGYQGRPASCGLPGGEFLVSWVSFGQNPNGSSIHSRIVDVDFGPNGDEFEVSNDASANGDYPTACCSDNGFVVAWQTPGAPYGSFDGSGPGIAARRYSLSGTPAGTEFRVNQATTAAQFAPQLACDSAGNFIVAWAGNIGVKARAYDSSGSALTAETDISNSFLKPSVGLDDNAVATIAWSESGMNPLDFDIYAQRFLVPGIGGPTTTLPPTTTTTITLPPSTTCGDPIDPPAVSSGDVGLVTASDALFALNAAVGLAACPLCVCDVNDSGAATAGDALAILNAAVGNPVTLTCPACN